MPSADRSELRRRLAELPGGRGLRDALAGLAGVHFVGGVVRDLLLGRTGPDLDLVVEGDALQVARTLAERLGGEVTDTHERFGTATVLAGGRRVDLASARAERYPAPGALPEVTLAVPLAEDLARRDFTVNALALSPDGALTAAPGALEDLDHGALRVLHDASFADDPTRLLRLVRYAERLGFEPEPRTAALAAAAIAAGAPATVSGARLGDELRLLLGEERAAGMLERAARMGLDTALHPRLAAAPATTSAELALLPPDGRQERLLLAAAARGFGSAERLGVWLDALEFPAEDRDAVIAAAFGAGPLGAALAAAGRPSEIAAAARGHTPEAVALAGARGPAGAVRAARAWLEDLRHVRLCIGGNDLLDAGLEPGPAIGRGLAAALAKRLDGEARGPEEELAAALAAARATEP